MHDDLQLIFNDFVDGIKRLRAAEKIAAPLPKQSRAQPPVQGLALVPGSQIHLPLRQNGQVKAAPRLRLIVSKP